MEIFQIDSTVASGARCYSQRRLALFLRVRPIGLFAGRYSSRWNCKKLWMFSPQRNGGENETRQRQSRQENGDLQLLDQYDFAMHSTRIAVGGFITGLAESGYANDGLDGMASRIFLPTWGRNRTGKR